MCEINLQCSGTENAGVCGKNQTCICNEGFIRSKEGCLPGKYVEDDHCQKSVPSNCYITFGLFLIKNAHTCERGTVGIDKRENI